jgi:diaminopimelate epimerase
MLVSKGKDESNRDRFSYEVSMYNPDGSSMGMCGNGIRCVSAFIARGHNLIGAPLNFLVEGRIIETEPSGPDGHIRVNMGVPLLEQGGEATLNIGGRSFRFLKVSMGNPHCVIFVERQVGDEVITLGSAIEKHSLFPERTNVEFVELVHRDHLNVRVWERGAGLTMACGTGACAAVVAGVKLNRCALSCRVSLPGGELFVEWPETQGPVFLSGPAQFVFSGDISDDLISKLFRR